MVKRDQMGSCEKVRVSGEEIQKVDTFICLGVKITTDDGMGKEVVHRVLDGRQVWGMMEKLISR